MQKEEAVPSDIFPHVYSFLVRFGFLKSAKVFRKEANVPRVVVDTPGLLDFYEAFKKRKKNIVDALQTKKETVTSKKRKAEKQISKKAVKKKKQSSSELSSEEEQKVIVTKNVAVKKKQSSSESSSEEEEQKALVTKNITKNKKIKQESLSADVEESSSSSSSDNEHTKSNGDGGASGVLPKHKKIAAAVKKAATSSSEDSSSDDDDPELSAKAEQSQKDDDKSSIDSSSDAPTTEQPIPIAKPHTVPKANKKLKTKPTSSQPFCRVDKQTTVDPKLADNSFEAKSGARGSWGEKAHHVLKNTKGRSFRHEKTKKKRGSYAGGRIDTGVHSIKFDDSN